MAAPAGKYSAYSVWRTIYVGSEARTYRLTAPGVNGRISVKSGSFTGMFIGNTTMDVSGKKIQVKSGTYGKVFLGKYYLLD